MAMYVDGIKDSIKAHVSIGKMNVRSNGSKSVPLYMADGLLKIAYTKYLLTWGATCNTYDKTGAVITDGSDGDVKYDMSIQFPNEGTEESDKFLKNLQEFEEYIKEQAVENAKAWFGKAQSAEIIEEKWSPMLKYPKKKGEDGEDVPDMDRAPTLKLKMPIYDGKFGFKVFSPSGQQVFPATPPVEVVDVIPKGSTVQFIMQCGGIWFSAGKFGVTWRPIQIAVRPKKTINLDVFMLAGGDDEEEEDGKRKRTEVESDTEEVPELKDEETVEEAIEETPAETEEVVEEVAEEVPQTKKRAKTGKKS